MSDMQKVRVSLTDADGNVHGVVGWCYGGRADNGVHGINVKEAEDEVNPWYIEIDEKLTPFAVIQELPTGLGAVVEVTFDDPEGPVSTQRYVRFDEGCWYDPHNGEDAGDSWLNTQKFTVLSEGVK